MITAMEVTKVLSHYYELSAPGINPVTAPFTQEDITTVSWFNPGIVVAVALPGDVVPSWITGTSDFTVKEFTDQGVTFNGQIIEQVDVPVGEDLSREYE
jgi:hypothetical protein